MGIVVAGRVMLHCAVIPEGQRAFGPREPADVLGAMVLLQQLSHQRSGNLSTKRLARGRIGQGIVPKERAIEEERRLSSFRVGAQQGVLNPEGNLPLELLDQLLPKSLRPAIKEKAVIIRTHHPFELLCDFLGQAQIGRVAIGKQRIPAIGRHVHTLSDGAQGGAFHPGHVRVPTILRPREILIVDDLSDVGILPRGAKGEGVEIAKALGEGDLLIFRQMLIAEEDGLPL